MTRHALIADRIGREYVPRVDPSSAGGRAAHFRSTGTWPPVRHR